MCNLLLVWDFLGMLETSCTILRDFWGKTSSEELIFLGIKYEPLLGPHPFPVIKISELGPSRGM